MSQPVLNIVSLLLIFGATVSLPVFASEAAGDAVRLTTAEIRQAFANVRDDARVQDDAGTTAVNHWYADGRFSNRWTNASGSGEVTGRWRAENDMRCITILTGLPQRAGKEICSPVYRRGHSYLSMEPDGSIHGVHKLSPLAQP